MPYISSMPIIPCSSPSSLFVHIAQFHDKFHHAIHLNYTAPTPVTILQVLLGTTDKISTSPSCHSDVLDEKRKSPTVETYPWHQPEISNIWSVDLTVATGSQRLSISKLNTHNHTAAAIRDFL